ncbi:VQ domain-containing protein [Dioscorea alata]|uniref:VQ domain-containing protein n=1 Tax=Dioscorea alata TaxID=55571 RepID=A0ACB7WDI2_DIOAL|nr:VQ domain-containing protein [Dioscorea alata]
MSGREGSKPVKVKIIETKYVQTDATQFKSVVQQLTGKDLVNVTESEGSRSLDKNKKTVERSTGGHDGREDVWPVQQDYEKMVVDASTSVTLDEFFKFLHD